MELFDMFKKKERIDKKVVVTEFPKATTTNLPTLEQEKAARVNTNDEYKVNAIEYLFDIQTMDIAARSNVDQLLRNESRGEISKYKKYLLYAYQPIQDKTYCIWAETNNDSIYIYSSNLENNIIKSSFYDSFEIEEFYGYDKNEFLGKLFELKQEIHLDAKIQAHIWSAMMKIFPEYTLKTTLRKPIYEKYFPYSFDNLVGAESYANSGILYRALPYLCKTYSGWVEFQTWKVCNWNLENQTMDLLHCSGTSRCDFTREELLSTFLGFNERDVNDALSSIPHRIIYIDDQDSKMCGAMHFSGDYRELHIYQSKTEKSIVVLKIYSVYNGHPMEGGRMEGYTFNQIKEIPAEHYMWTDKELIAEYFQYFK